MINKRLSYFTLSILLACICFVSCGSAKIPDIANVDEMSAKNLLSSNGIIPAVVYEYNDDVAEGCVIRTEPIIGSSVSKNSVVTIYISKGTELTVPDVVDVDEETAKKVLTSLQLIPSISYEYSDTIIEGNVTRTDPEIGSIVEPNSKITVYLSYGPSYVEATNVDMEVDYLMIIESCKVYRSNSKLYVDCNNFWFNPWSTRDYAGEWYDPNNTGSITGVASLTNNYYLSVPIYAKYPQKSWDGYTSQSFTIEIPMSDLGEDKPSTIYIKIYIAFHDQDIYEQTIALTISW